MPYQSFPNSELGDSRSKEKLCALKLPSLKGTRVLDLGCNEGFFCNKALELGAREVIGVDKNAGFIKKAKDRFPQIDFRAQSWDEELPVGSFDVILCLSAFHYAAQPQQLIDRVVSKLSPQGVFVLECGVFKFNNYARWLRVDRQAGSVMHPTKALLENYLLAKHVFCLRGESVIQAGDPVPRYVYHISAREKTLLLIGGPSGSGKSLLTRELDTDTESLSLDKHLEFIKDYANSKLAGFVKEHYVQGELHQLYLALNNSLFVDDFAASIFEILPPANTQAIEGYGLSLENISSAIKKHAIRAGFRSWEIQPSSDS